MKIDHDNLKEKYLKAGHSFGEACGKANTELKSIICDWLIDRKNILVFFGPPGAGKSWLIKRLREDANSLLVETSGLNINLNSFLLKLKGVEFAAVVAPKDICLKRIEQRENSPLDEYNDRESLYKLVNEWFVRYNGGWKWCLPTARTFEVG